MFNMKGEVVGIASYILSESGGFQGLGFAATSNVCKILLIAEPSPWSGIDAIFVSGKLANALNISQAVGLLVQKVTLLSPLGILGIKGGTIPIEYNGEVVLIGGDIILAVNDIPLVNQAKFEQARNSFSELKKGDSFTLIVLRDGRKEKLNGKI